MKEKKAVKKRKDMTELERWFAFMHRVKAAVYRPVLFPYKKHGHTEYYNDRAYLIVGNHYSLFDVVLAAEATGGPIHFMAKSELFKKGLMKKFVNKCQAIPVNRDGNDIKAVMMAMKYLKKGESVAIFPEGTRNKSKEGLLPFKSGAAALSIKTRTPIIPVVQIKKIRFMRRAHVIYGEPVEFSEYYGKKLSEEDLAACDEKLRDIILGLQDELREILKTKKKR